MFLLRRGQRLMLLIGPGFFCLGHWKKITPPIRHTYWLYQRVGKHLNYLSIYPHCKALHPTIHRLTKQHSYPHHKSFYHGHKAATTTNANTTSHTESGAKQSPRSRMTFSVKATLTRNPCTHSLFKGWAKAGSYRFIQRGTFLIQGRTNPKTPSWNTSARRNRPKTRRENHFFLFLKTRLGHHNSTRDLYHVGA